MVQGDLFTQLRAEVLGRPDSWFTQEVYAWYDALYSASESIDDYDNSSGLPEGFEQYDFTSLETLFASVAVDLGRMSFNSLVRTARSAL